MYIGMHKKVNILRGDLSNSIEVFVSCFYHNWVPMQFPF